MLPGIIFSNILWVYGADFKLQGHKIMRAQEVMCSLSTLNIIRWLGAAPNRGMLLFPDHMLRTLLLAALLVFPCPSIVMSLAAVEAGRFKQPL